MIVDLEIIFSKIIFFIILENKYNIFTIYNIMVGLIIMAIIIGIGILYFTYTSMGGSQSSEGPAPMFGGGKFLFNFFMKKKNKRNKRRRNK